MGPDRPCATLTDETFGDIVSASDTSIILTMLVAIIAGALYAAVVFLIGFIFGTLRVMVLVPALSDTTAVLLELAFILLASWFVCRWCVDRLRVCRSAQARALMSVVAFVVLMVMEFGLGITLGRWLVDQLAGFTSPAGAMGLTGQIVFGLFPVVQVRRR